MDNLNWTTFEVDEMNFHMMNETNGGILLMYAAMTFASIYYRKDIQDFWEGFADGWNNR